jgi:hypothetical protein
MRQSDLGLLLGAGIWSHGRAGGKPKRARSKTIGCVSEVTLLTPVRPGRIAGEGRTYEQRLWGALESVQRRIERGIPTPIGQLPTIHFARWLILRPAQYLHYSDVKSPARDTCRSWLFFTSNFDGDMKDYLREFSVFLGEDVDRIWGNCEDWPSGGARNFEAFWDYAKRHQIPTHAFYAAYPELTVGRIRQLDRFKRAFDRLVARTRRADGATIDDVARLLDRFLAENGVYPSDFPMEGGTYASDTE